MGQQMNAYFSIHEEEAKFLLCYLFSVKHNIEFHTVPHVQ
jgi:hypothetical protein